MDDIPLDDIAGDINVPQDEDALGTLDEPVSTTLVRRQPPCVLNVSLCVQKRDMKAILYKCRHVIIPGRSKALLHDCKLPLSHGKKKHPNIFSGDLWGPLFLCIILAM